MDKEKLTGPYILWKDYGVEGWKPESFKSLMEALKSDKYVSNWIITKTFSYEVKEIPE